MRRVHWQAFFILLVCATILRATHALIAGALAAPLSAEDQAVEAAGRAFEKAVAKDPLALEMQTDPAFTWIDATGTLQSREEILDAFGAGTAPRLLVRIFCDSGFVLCFKLLRASLSKYAERDSRLSSSGTFACS